MFLRLLFGLCAAAALLTAAAWQRQPDVPFGFSPSSAASYLPAEERFRQLPSSDRIRDAHRHLSAKPHVAGSARDLELANWTLDRFREYGLEDVEITSHEVLLPWPEEVSVEMIRPRPWRASMKEDPVDGDPYTQVNAEEIGVPYHAYSASGTIEAPVVYAGSGNPADYDRLASLGVDVRGKIVLVRYSVPYSYRGFKALTAQQRGAAGLLIYSDPADDGYAKGKVYPDGPWGPDSHIQRGGVVYDFLVPGDPLTPGWPSLPGARRIPREEAISLPKIISAPLSHKDARAILESMTGSEAPAEWRGGLPLKYRTGGELPLVRLRVKLDDAVRPIWTVTGIIRGTEYPDDVVIVGNHRDAWVYGGVDPSSGSAALMELARTLGELQRSGWRPRRSILFASWDAEEFTLTSSTEWGEQHRERLRRHAVAYVNVDSAASGPDFTASAVPSLNRVIAEAAQIVRDPRRRSSVAAAVRDRRTRERSALPTGSSNELVDNRLGSGSDYTVFLNHLGIPVADLSFDGPYGVYHSLYDNHNWVAKIGDPGFVYHAALVQLWGIVTLRLANADIIPLDYEPYAQAVAEFGKEIESRASASGIKPRLSNVMDAAAQMADAAKTFNTRTSAALERGDKSVIALLNRRLMDVERSLLDDDGIPGRPWYRHLVFAPRPTYAPEVLPGVAEALTAADTDGAHRQADRLAQALLRAAELLR